MTLKVLSAGFQASLQDAGRHGTLAYGVAQSGVMDEYAYHWANKILGNAADSAVIEMPFGQVSFQAEGNCHICLTGANCNLSINQQKAPRYTAITIKKDDVIELSFPVEGVYAYLAISGGFAGETLFHSRSTNLREHLGKSLAVGDILEALPHKKQRQTKMPMHFMPNYTKPIKLQFIEGSQIEQCAGIKSHLYQQTYQISQDCNRTGYRLNATKPLVCDYQNMVSEGMLAGAVQLPPNGQPIIMMKDHPTMGGYPKIGQIHSLDLSQLAQRQPRSSIQFAPISLEKAQRKRRKFNQFFRLSC